MIQRIQTLFLAGVVACMALTFATRMWQKSHPDLQQRVVMNIWHLDRLEAPAGTEAWTVAERRSHPWLALMAAASVLVATYAIFRYDKRMLQIKLGLLNAFLIMATLAGAAFTIYSTESALGWLSKGVFGPGYFLPVGALILNSLASRFIKKDEDLVRSVDRIR